MDSKYIITSSGSFINVNELYHHGTKGMRWGVRRYQNPDGSLTAAGRKRYTNSDGTLNKKGEKYYSKEKERLSNEKKTLIAQKHTSSKLEKLEAMRKKNAGLKDEIDSKKKNSSDEDNKLKQKSASEMSDAELQNKVNRLRNEDAYRDLSKKLGYDGSKTELDARIADMEKQKRYLELQRDIKNLTPKKENRAKKIIEKIWGKVIEPVAIEVGKKYLKDKLGDLGTKAAEETKKTVTKEAESVEKTVKDSAERVKRKKEKKEAKRNARQNNGTVEGTGNSSNRNNSNHNKTKSNTVFDMEPYGYLNTPVSSSTVSRNTQSGRSYASNYMNTPINRLPSSNIAGYLTAPKDDD